MVYIFAFLWNFTIIISCNLATSHHPSCTVAEESNLTGNLAVNFVYRVSWVAIEMVRVLALNIWLKNPRKMLWAQGTVLFQWSLKAGMVPRAKGSQVHLRICQETLVEGHLIHKFWWPQFLVIVRVVKNQLAFGHETSLVIEEMWCS